MQFCPHYDDPAKDHVMASGWLGCLYWSLTNPNIVAAFEGETGRHFRIDRSSLDRMIDDACGLSTDDAVWEYLSAFAVWMNENVWGDASEEDD